MKKSKIKSLTPKQVIEKLNNLRGQRGNWENTWQDIGDYMLPRKNDIQVVKTPGEAKYNQILDGTAITSGELLAGALHSMLTNPAGFFFNLTTGVPELDQNDNVRKWLQGTVRDMHTVLNNTNFQTEVHEFDTDIIYLGTAATHMEEDESDVLVRFKTLHIKEVFIEENSKGVVDSLYRPYCADARSLVDDFGYDNVSKKVREAYDAHKPDKFNVIHAVYPVSKVKDPNTKFKFVSQYLLEDERMDLEVEGFMEFPTIVARWTKASGETYGRGCGEKALPETKMIQQIMLTTIKGAQKTVDPPLQAPDESFIGPIVTRPGGISYYRAGTEERVEPIFNDARIDFGFQMIEMVRTSIREAFYVDQLKLRNGPQMTATEVMERTEQAMRFLGPMLARLQVEFLQPMVERLYKIMDRRGKIQPVPEELTDIEIKVQFSSVIALSQRMSEVQNIQRTMQNIAPFQALDPAIGDNIDGDQAIRYMAKMFNFPMEMIRDEKARDQMREQRAQAQQAAMQAEREAQEADTASKLMKAAPQTV